MVDSRQILNKVMTLLALDKKVNLGGLLYAKLEDGTPIAANAFEIGQQLAAVDADGLKKPIEDGHHVAYLPTSNGTKRYNVMTNGGTITRLDLDDRHNSIVNKVNYENNPADQIEDKNTSNPYATLKPNNKMVRQNKATHLEAHLAPIPGLEGTPGPDKQGEVTKNNESDVVKKLQDGTYELADVANVADAHSDAIAALEAKIQQIMDWMKEDQAEDQEDQTEDSEEDMDNEMETMSAEGPDQPGKVTKSNEAEEVKKRQKSGSSLQGAPNYGQPVVAKANMSKAKKFTGAPVAAKQEQALAGLVQHKTQNTFSRVLARMANNNF